MLKLAGLASFIMMTYQHRLTLAEQKLTLISFNWNATYSRIPERKKLDVRVWNAISQ